MNWKSPKELPNKGDLIWILIIKSRDKKVIANNQANAFLARVSEDEWGVLFAQEKREKKRYFFYTWAHTFNIPFMKNNPEQMIRAWATFDELPDFKNYNTEESMSLIRSSDSFKERWNKIKDITRRDKEQLYVYLLNKCEKCHQEFDKFMSVDSDEILWGTCCGNYGCNTYANKHLNANKIGIQIFCPFSCRNQRKHSVLPEGKE